MKRITVLKAMGIVAVLALPMTLFRAAYQARDAALESNCRSNLHQYGFVLRNYADAHGALPPASATDSTGRPVHSWRALLLRDWSEHDLSGRYDFRVPWDHPNNAPLATYDTPSAFYWCPCGDGRQTKETDYVAVVGPHTAWPGSVGRPLSQITDDPASTILVVELSPSGIPWMEPRDVTLEEILRTGLRGNHPHHVNALFADFRVRRVRKDVDRATLRALLTVDGGERIDPRSWKMPAE